MWQPRRAAPTGTTNNAPQTTNVNNNVSNRLTLPSSNSSTYQSFTSLLAKTAHLRPSSNNTIATTSQQQDVLPAQRPGTVPTNTIRHPTSNVENEGITMMSTLDESQSFALTKPTSRWSASASVGDGRSSRADAEAALERDRHRRSLDDVWRQLQQHKQKLKEETERYAHLELHTRLAKSLIESESELSRALWSQEADARLALMQWFYSTSVQLLQRGTRAHLPRAPNQDDLPLRTVRDSDLLRTLRAKDRVVEMLVTELQKRGWELPKKTLSSAGSVDEDEFMNIQERLMRYCAADALADRVAVVAAPPTWVYFAKPNATAAVPLVVAPPPSVPLDYVSALSGSTSDRSNRLQLSADAVRRPMTQPGGRRRKNKLLSL